MVARPCVNRAAVGEVRDRAVMQYVALEGVHRLCTIMCMLTEAAIRHKSIENMADSASPVCPSVLVPAQQDTVQSAFEHD